MRRRVNLNDSPVFWNIFQVAPVHYFAAQLPFFGQKIIAATVVATVNDVVPLIVSCAAVIGLFDTLG